jgi:hypothetical protein
VEILVLALLLGTVCVALPVVLVVLLAVRASRRAEERRAGLAGYAAHREWEYRAEDPSLVSRFTSAPFGRGSSRRATNVLLGRHDGRSFVAFDYSFVTSSSSGDTTSSTTHRYSVLALHVGRSVPALSVAPSGTMSRLFNALTNSDIPVGDPEFDRAFTVKSPVPEFARDVLHPGMLEVLRHHPDLAWRLEGDSMLVLRPGEHGPQEVEAKLHFMDAVLDRIPQRVWDRLGGER